MVHAASRVAWGADVVPKPYSFVLLDAPPALFTQRLRPTSLGGTVAAIHGVPTHPGHLAGQGLLHSLSKGSGCTRRQGLARLASSDQLLYTGSTESILAPF